MMGVIRLWANENSIRRNLPSTALLAWDLNVVMGWTMIDSVRKSFLPLWFIVSAAVNGAEPLVLKESTVLDPAKTYGAIVIAASGITVDGAGAIIEGARDGDPKSFQGTGITLKGVEKVTLKNISARGWETGLRIEDAKGCVIEACNFSGNFHDPKFGWGEQGRRGGIVLENSHECTLRRNKANQVWDGCVLFNSDENKLEGNDFSHTSNTCLKLWNASRNVVEGNNLSYGIRIDPGEVHARDSTSVLIESGSNDNQLTKNDCSHGGDGIFVRVLNQWVSTGNVFTENDCSYANNNCVEAWSPRNTWIRNKANHGSYGFWLGASDQNVLIENEASYNGLKDGHHNSPHLPENGHAGIVFMFGPSSHTMLRGNRCVGNNGAGIAAIGDLESKGVKWRAFHWIIQQNTLEENRWGIFMQHTEEMLLADNHFKGNTESDVMQSGDVVALRELKGVPSTNSLPKVDIQGPQRVTVGQEVTWSGGEGPEIKYHWSLQSGSEDGGGIVRGEKATFAQTFKMPGFYRLALTVDDGRLADLAWRDVYVTEPIVEIGTEGNAADWSWADDQSKVKFTDDATHHLQGNSALLAQINPYSGVRVTLRCAFKQPVPLPENRTHLVFWIKTRNEGTPAWQDVNPPITLHGPGGKSAQLTPTGDFLSNLPYNEAREGWAYFSVPLAGNDRWKRSGDTISEIEKLDIGFDSWGAPPLWIWLDGLGLR